MRLALLLLLASAGCFLLFLGLQVLEMNRWQGAEHHSELGAYRWVLE